jgi:hypothetical protein
MIRGAYHLTALALLCGGAPAAAQTGTTNLPVRTSSAEVMNDALIRYGQFARQVNVAEQPALAAFSTFGEEIRAAMAMTDRVEGARRVHAVVDRTRAAIATADGQVVAVQVVDVPEMKLPAELQPAAQVRSIRTVNAQMREVIAGFGTAADAFARNDGKAAMASARSLISNVRLVLDAQALLARGHAAAVPPESGARELLEFEAIYFHLGSRLLSAYRLDGVRAPDLALAADLTAIAAQVDALREARSARIEAMIVRANTTAEDARAKGDTARQALAERVSRVFQAGRPAAGLMEQFSAVARRGAETFRSKPVDAVTLNGLMRDLKAVQQGIIAFAAAENNVAGSPAS